MQNFRVQLHYARFLLWEFRRPLIVFWSLVFGCGWVLWHYYHAKQLRYLEACHQVFQLIFLEGNLDFPQEWYLQPLFFLLPIIGLGAIADSVVRLGFLIFAQRQKLPEWHRMIASLYRNHIIVVGLGKVGFRIVNGLLELRENVVIIEEQANSPLLDEIRALNIPVIHGDGRQSKTLKEAGIQHARAFIAATSNDLANLDAALTARDINPKVRVVLRIFDDTLASKFGEKFHMPCVSTAKVAAPAFIAAARGNHVYHQFDLSGRQVHLTELTIHPHSQLIGKNVGEIQSQARVNIVMHKGAGGVNVNPGHEITFRDGDSILVIAPIEDLRELEVLNQEQNK